MTGRLFVTARTLHHRPHMVAIRVATVVARDGLKPTKIEVVEFRARKAMVELLKEIVGRYPDKNVRAEKFAELMIMNYESDGHEVHVVTCPNSIEDFMNACSKLFSV